MKNLKTFTVFLILILSLAAFAEENCPQRDHSEVETLIENFSKVTDAMYKDVATLKVNHDGDGKISIYFENGVPKIIKFTYKNGSGTVTMTKSFAEIEKGIPLVYENKSVKGRAIVLEKGSNFKSGNDYNFKFSVRTSVDPDKLTTYPVQLDANPAAPKLSHSNKTFKSITLDPGISYFSWDGTFTGVSFK